MNVMRYNLRRETILVYLVRTLSALGSTQVEIDPDLPAAHELRRWYIEEGMNIEMTDLSMQLNSHENSK